MFQLKDLLFEQAGRSTELSKENAIGVYKQSCRSHTPVNRKIWRGTNASISSGLGVVNPKESKRTSVGDSGNHYTLLLDNLRSWSDFPKRSRSLICAMSSEIASGFGTPYVIIPFDGADFAVAPRHDIWYSFQRGLSDVFNLDKPYANLPDTNKALDLLYHFSENKSGNIKNTSGVNDKEWSSFVRSLKKIDNNIDLIKRQVENIDKSESRVKHHIAEKIAEKVKESSSSLIELLSEALDPGLNGFVKKEYKKGFKTRKKNMEVWTESKCLMVRGDLYNDFIKEVN